MNERIFELAKQADLIQWDTLSSGARTPDHESVVKARKFAELIVKECLSMCDETQAVYYKHRLASLNFTDKNRYAAGETAADTIYTKIKLHFGVEE